MIPAPRHGDSYVHPAWCDPERCTTVEGETEHESGPLINIVPPGDTTCRVTVRAHRVDDVETGPTEPSGVVLDVVQPEGSDDRTEARVHLTIGDLDRLGHEAVDLAAALTALATS